MIKTITAFMILMLLSAAGQTRASTVVLLDTTKPANLLPSMVAEVSAVAGAMPGGERLIVYRLGQGWIAAFDDNLNASTRVKLGQILTATYPVKGRPHWVTRVPPSDAAPTGCHVVRRHFRQPPIRVPLTSSSTQPSGKPKSGEARIEDVGSSI